jgi:hypothetical protein
MTKDIPIPKRKPNRISKTTRAIRLLEKGKLTPKQIATKLNISPTVVYKARARLKQKKMPVASFLHDAHVKAYEKFRQGDGQLLWEQYGLTGEPQPKPNFWQRMIHRVLNLFAR